MIDFESSKKKLASLSAAESSFIIIAGGKIPT
jgi:hypothetical protein